MRVVNPRNGSEFVDFDVFRLAESILRVDRAVKWGLLCRLQSREKLAAHNLAKHREEAQNATASARFYSDQVPFQLSTLNQKAEITKLKPENLAALVNSWY